MGARRAKVYPVTSSMGRVVEILWATCYARRRVIWAATAFIAVAAVLWFVTPYMQSWHAVSKLQDALQRADGKVLLSMCFRRERELLQVSPKQVQRVLQDLYRFLQVKQVVVNVERRSRGDILCKIALLRADGSIVDLGIDGVIPMVYRGGSYRLFSLSGFLYTLAERAVVMYHHPLQGEETPAKRTLIRQSVQQFLQGYGIKGVFDIDLRNQPEIAWKLLRHPDEPYKFIDFDKHVSLGWPEN